MPSAPPATAVAAVEWIEVAGHGFTSRSSPPMAQFNHRSQDIAGEGLDVSHQRDHNLALNTAINRRRSGSYAPSCRITSTWEGDPPVRRRQYHKGLGLTCESPRKVELRTYSYVPLGVRPRTSLAKEGRGPGAYSRTAERAIRSEARRGRCGIWLQTGSLIERLRQHVE
jgi:hypothetical protein